MKKPAVLFLLLIVSFSFADPQRPTEPSGNVMMPKTLLQE